MNNVKVEFHIEYIKAGDIFQIQFEINGYFCFFHFILHQNMSGSGLPKNIQYILVCMESIQPTTFIIINQRTKDTKDNYKWSLDATLILFTSHAAS